MAQSKNGNRMDKKREEGQQRIAPKRQVYLVTGPTSGIGSLIIRKLLEKGEVRALVQEHSDTNDGWHNRLPPGVIPYVADITMRHAGERAKLEEACRGVDVIFHLAAITNQKNATFDEYINVNVIGTENVLRACVDANPGDKEIRFIFMSSISVYGNQRPGEIITEESEMRPSTPYGESKHMAEQVVRAFADAHSKIKYTIFRTANMYGTNYEKSVNIIMKYILEQKMFYPKAGANHLSFIHSEDAARALISAAGAPQAVNRTYNLTDGVDYTLKQVLDKTAQFLNVPKPTKSVHPVIMRIGARLANMNPADVDFLMSDRVISISRIREELRFHPEKSIDKEGLEMAKQFLAARRKISA